MPRRPGNSLQKWEVAIVKAMLARKYVPQDVQAYFSRPTRSINHARISEIRDGPKHKAIKAASDADLDAFLEAWPSVDPGTGLHLQGDELLVKAREAMIAAVQTFNNPDGEGAAGNGAGNKVTRPRNAFQSFIVRGRARRISQSVFIGSIAGKGELLVKTVNGSEMLCLLA